MHCSLPAGQPLEAAADDPRAVPELGTEQRHLGSATRDDDVGAGSELVDGRVGARTDRIVERDQIELGELHRPAEQPADLETPVTPLAGANRQRANISHARGRTPELGHEQKDPESAPAVLRLGHGDVDAVAQDDIGIEMAAVHRTHAEHRRRDAGRRGTRPGTAGSRTAPTGFSQVGEKHPERGGRDKLWTAVHGARETGGMRRAARWGRTRSRRR